MRHDSRGEHDGPARLAADRCDISRCKQRRTGPPPGPAILLALPLDRQDKPEPVLDRAAFPQAARALSGGDAAGSLGRRPRHRPPQHAGISLRCGSSWRLYRVPEIARGENPSLTIERPSDDETNI